MARLESVALAGYFPTPSSVIPMVASLVEVNPAENYSYLDPCAGEGDAILGLLDNLYGTDSVSRAVMGELYTVELEKGRHEKLKERVSSYKYSWSGQCLHGDTFKVTWENKPKGVSLLWLNPPYDFDKRYGRLEEKFLARYTSALAPNGVLIFLVPFYALKASAETLARSYDRVECFKFPEGEFEVFKQVVLLATKRDADLFEPDPELVEKILAWSKDPGVIPSLPAKAHRFSIPKSSYALDKWAIAPLDITGLVKDFEPWMVTDRMGQKTQITGIVPEGNLEDYLTVKYPVAMPPRSAHIAAGLAAGIFNGAMVSPDNPSSGLPEILVKGIFDKEFKTVEEKQDKNGNIKGVVQVQQPKLVTTVLDLSSGEFTTIKPLANLTGSKTLKNMTMADLLAEYGEGLMKVMLTQCPVLHNPRESKDQIPLPEVPRPLFHAQHQAAQAIVKLLGGLGTPKAKRRFKAAYVLGEIGSGKTGTSLVAAEAIGAKRILVMCPPHLLDSWAEQIAAVTPWAKTYTLTSISDIQELAADKSEKVIAILSRETAKLGHGIDPVTGYCPKCGAPVDTSIDLAKKRARCEATKIVVTGPTGKLAIEIALALYPAFPKDPWINQILNSRPFRNSKKEESSEDAWERVKPKVRALALRIAETVDKTTWPALQALLASLPEPQFLVDVATTIFRNELAKQSSEKYYRSEMIQKVEDILLLVDSPLTVEAAENLRAESPDNVLSGYYYSKPLHRFSERYNNLYGAEGGYSWSSLRKDEKGNLKWDDNFKVGSPRMAIKAIGFLGNEGLEKSEPCGEPLYQAAPRPRRYPLATYIARKHPKLFDLFIADECQEVSTDGSAQERAAHRIMSLGVPTLLLTGTVMNGYADSLFTNTWQISSALRAEFNRDEQAQFANRYGYRKRYVEEKDGATGEVIAYGSVTDRVERSERLMGKSPGVLPLFLFKHLLPISVTLHKSDLSMEIPDCDEIVEKVQPSRVQLDRFKALQDSLVRQIKQDRFDPELAGKLWGAMAELPSYLDLAAIGNVPDGSEYEVAYPKSVGGQIVASASLFSKDSLLPKEEWLINRVKASIKEGRNVLVFCWHTSLLPRLAALLEEHLDTKCPILEPSKVPTKKRQAWIDKEVVKKKRRVLVVNPVTIQTGLNNLVYFSDQVWVENPACNPITYRQTVGRVDRIGQTLRTRIFFPIYSDTPQEALHSLLLHKVAVSMSTDGLDAENALAAAGIGDTESFSSFAVGRQLYNLLTQQRLNSDRPLALAIAS